VSFPKLALPEATSRAPAEFTLFAQPRPVAPTFPHGHAAPDPSPGQNAEHTHTTHALIVLATMQAPCWQIVTQLGSIVPVTRTKSPSWNAP
jgi:hypothetical protein